MSLTPWVQTERVFKDDQAIKNVILLMLDNTRYSNEELYQTYLEFQKEDPAPSRSFQLRLKREGLTSWRTSSQRGWMREV